MECLAGVSVYLYFDATPRGRQLFPKLGEPVTVNFIATRRTPVDRVLETIHKIVTRRPNPEHRTFTFPAAAISKNLKG
jgi:hypothetical protein